jgi:hypothetical protein
MTPEEKYSGTKSKVNHLRIFGSLAYLHVPRENRKKLDSKTQPCLFVGYDEQSKVYRLFDPLRRKIVLSRDVVVDENRVGYHHLKSTNTTYEDPFPVMSAPELKPGIELASENQDYQPNLENEPAFHEDPNDVQPVEHPDIVLEPHAAQSALPRKSPTRPLPAAASSVSSNKRYPTHTRAPSSRLRDYWTLLSEILEEPISYKDAIKEKGWKSATKKEIDSVLKNQTWEVVNRKQWMRTISAKWIFKVKQGTLGQPVKLKARIVARGFQ